MSYSNGSGGTLTIPSPTHVHHVDVGSAVRSLRRSLSRSPSKFRLRTTVTPVPVVETIGTSGPATPSAGVGSFSFGQESTTPPSPGRPAPVAQVPAVPSPFGISPCEIPAFLTPQPSHTTSTPFKPSVKLSLRSARSRPAASRPLSRTRVSPKSPLKRVFGPSTDSGNPIPPPASEPEPQGQENPSFSEFALALSPVSRRNLEKPSRHSMHLDVSGSSKNGISKFLGTNTDSFTSISVSPMKRSDAMSVDESSLGSPVAKRRSLHGVSSLGLGSGFNILDLQPAPQQGSGSQQGFDIHDDANQEYQLTGALGTPFRETRDAMPPPTPTATANMPKRSSSLRKSTLQQRHGDTRTSLGRRAGEKQLAQFAPSVAATPSHGERPRLSLDQYLPLEEYNNLFSPKAPLQNPSVHPMPRPVNQPHPLSRTLTQSSSSSSVPDDSPTHAPIQLGERPRVPLNFSKSLPPGSTRPVNGPKPVETPDYKRAKPLQSAFMSTGLVSKMTRNPDLGLPDAPNSKITAMPDTPCKKQYPANTYPPQNSGGRRPSRPSFGSPSSPFRSSAIGPGRGNIFGLRDRPSANSFFQSSRQGHARKVSLLSLDGDDHNEPTGSQDDIPPTPTKSFLRTLGNTPSPAVQTPTISRSYLFGQPSFGMSSEEAAPSPSCKFTTVPPVVGTSVGQIKNEGFSAIMSRPSTPTPAVAPRVSSALRRNVQARRQANCLKSKVANAVPLASPLNPTGTPVGTAPQTPQDSFAPPDASRLSISQDDKERRCRTPATPTPQSQKFFAGPIDRRSSVTPHKNHAPLEVDESLIRMFDKAEPIGSGEFSQVYRVVKSSVPASLTALFTATSTKRSPLAPSADKVFAVKKIRFPSFGVKARQSKYREVNVLRSLVNSDKIIQYIHHWEANGHLYIQTEYCEEGSLDKFLAVVGKTGKLDEFRVWKILQETLQGLSAIHAAGFIHLDLKPANIFITQDGYLKIGDFGMAVEYPAPKDVDGEGDREYIAPEILIGRIDKPADIFAVGLITLEAACNVILPDNGPTWQALRNDGVAELSWPIATSETVPRDTNGVPLDALYDSEGFHLPVLQRHRYPFGQTHNPSNLFGGSPRRNQEHIPPYFMGNPDHPDSLDKLVAKMLSSDPEGRPTAQQLLAVYPIVWVNHRRTAGAIIYEGNYGPISPEAASLAAKAMIDTEMTDV